MNKRTAALILALTYTFSAASYAFADENIDISKTGEIESDIAFLEETAAESDGNTTGSEGVEDVDLNEIGSDALTEDTQETKESEKVARIPYNELTENLYSVKYALSDGLTYTRNILNHSTYGNEREYILEYNPDSDTDIVFLKNDYLYKTDIMRNMATNTYPERNFIAGINADFFNMSTGVPESAYIKDYELYTTDRDTFCLAQTEDNKYFFDKPHIKLKMISEDETVYHIQHLNKEFTDQGLYLYNSRYSDKTHIKNDYTSAILYSYTDRLEIQEIKELINDLNLSREITKYVRTIDKTTEDAIKLKERIDEIICERTDYQPVGDAYFILSDINPRIGNTEKLVVKEIIGENSNSEIPENAYLVCADNTTYGYVLRKLSAGDTFTFYIEGNEAFYDVKNAIGTGAVILRDSETIDDTSINHYTSLQPRSAVGIKEDGTLVFYAVDGRRTGHSSGMKLLDLAEQMKSLGCTYAANFDGGGSTAVNASLPGFDNANTVNVPSQTNERKISNAIGFFNDVEKTYAPSSAYAYGDYYYTLNDWYVSLGQIVVSDENGFSLIEESDDDLPLEEATDFKNSDITEDVNDETAVGEDRETPVENQENNNPDSYENIDVSEKEQTETLIPENVSLYIKDGAGFIADGTVYPAGNIGAIEVYATLDGGETENIAATVISIESPDEIVITTEKSVFAPFENVSFVFEALFRKLSVAAGFSNFEWSVKPVIETELVQEENEAEDTDISDDTESGETEENNTSDAENALQNDDGALEEPLSEDANFEEIIYGTFEEGLFIPAVKGMKLELTAKRGDVTGSIIVEIDDYPFADMENHWAKEEIYDLAVNGIVKGQYDEQGIAYYLPERNYSRYEFCVMVERISDIGSNIEVPPYKSDTETLEEVNGDLLAQETETFTDEVVINDTRKASEEAFELDLYDADLIPEWAYESVYRLYASGLLDEIIHTDENNNKFFYGDNHITRADVMKVLGKICENASDDFTIDEYHDLTDEQKNDIHFKNVINAGLFSGYEDMSLRPNNNLTRAEAAAVFSRLYNLK